MSGQKGSEKTKGHMDNTGGSGVLVGHRTPSSWAQLVGSTGTSASTDRGRKQEWNSPWCMKAVISSTDSTRAIHRWT